MTDGVHHTFNLEDYALDVMTTHHVSFAPYIAEPEDAFIKHVAATVLHYTPGPTVTSETVGQVNGWLILGTLACLEGSDLLEACDAHSEELLGVHQALHNFAPGGLLEEDNFLYVQRIELLQTHDSLTLRCAVFDRVVNTLEVPIAYAAASGQSFALTRGRMKESNWESTLPDQSVYLPQEHLVVLKTQP